jgi:glycosyltransferase involved in cell wall biosynthesis
LAPGNLAHPGRLAVGELKAQKNHALLLHALAELDPALNAGLVILGEGALLDETRRRAVALGLGDRVSFQGHVLDPSPYYRAAELFVLSSDYEGFGNVLVEALSAGLPIVSTDCRDGPAEILESGRFGTLVPIGDVAALAEALVRARQMSVDPERQKERARAFNEHSAVEQYLTLMLGQDSAHSVNGGKAIPDDATQTR